MGGGDLPDREGRREGEGGLWNGRSGGREKRREGGMGRGRGRIWRQRESEREGWKDIGRRKRATVVHIRLHDCMYFK